MPGSILGSGQREQAQRVVVLTRPPSPVVWQEQDQFGLCCFILTPLCLHFCPHLSYRPSCLVAAASLHSSVAFQPPVVAAHHSQFDVPKTHSTCTQSAPTAWNVVHKCALWASGALESLPEHRQSQTVFIMVPRCYLLLESSSRQHCCCLTSLEAAAPTCTGGHCVLHSCHSEVFQNAIFTQEYPG